jgi:hypothetical protein
MTGLLDTILGLEGDERHRHQDQDRDSMAYINLARKNKFGG